MQLANTASSSSNDDSQSKSSLRRLKEKLPGSPPHTDGQTQRHHDVENQLNGHAAQQQGSERQAIGPQHTTGADRSSLHQQNIDGSQQRHQPVGQQPTGNAADAATAEGDSAAVAKGVPASGHQQTSGEQRHNANMQSGLLPGVGQTECSPGQSQQTEEEEHQQAGDWWSAAGLQKPPKVGEEDPDCGLSKLCSPRCLSQKRAKKKSLHKALQNPTDLFWDAVWIEPEDIIREVMF